MSDGQNEVLCLRLAYTVAESEDDLKHHWHVGVRSENAFIFAVSKSDFVRWTLAKAGACWCHGYFG